MPRAQHPGGGSLQAQPQIGNMLSGGVQSESEEYDEARALLVGLMPNRNQQQMLTAGTSLQAHLSAITAATMF